MVVKRIMLVWFLLLGSVLSTPSDEFKEVVNNGLGDFTQNGYVANIVPSRISADLESQYSTSNHNELPDSLKSNSFQDNNYFKIFMKYVAKGVTSRDLTFSIYDDNMREAAIALFRLFENTADETFEDVVEWAKKNINAEMYMYALRLESLYSSKTNDSTLLPPFVWNPNYFVNGESLAKLSLRVDNVITNPIDASSVMANKLSKINPYFKTKELVVVNSNYSGWNLQRKGKEDLLNYFREDISLNSYYFGIHLLHPYWMSNEELENMNPRFAEHYYYAHQQLVARYNLEKLHIKVKNVTNTFELWDYVPYLRYKNGMSFPKRSCVLGDWTDEEAYIKTIDIALREYISRGIILMRNGETLVMTDDSHINLLAKLIRANLDSIKFAKVIRTTFGYGINSFPLNEYTPAPSILHHPETSMHDPAYWILMQHMLAYFIDYKNTMEPFDMSQYESEEFEIVDSHISKLTTHFDSYRFPVNQALSNYIKSENDWTAFLEVRQRRLQHSKFSFNFTVESKVVRDTIVRLYLGPECDKNNCWTQYNKFFELDTFHYNLKEGENVITWSPETSKRFSFDDYYNTVLPIANPATKYSIYRFPENLLIPRGVKEGLNLTLFIMITPKDANDYEETSFTQNLYREVSNEIDSKPLGFPFHRQAKSVKDTAFNYKFYNISIYHKSQEVDFRGYFSPHLY